MVKAYKKQLKDKAGNYVYPVITEGGTAMSEGDYRLDTYANADGIVVPSGANLNTLEYLKVGKYVCKTDAIAGSIVNRPGTTLAWTMTVKNPLDNTHDDEASRGYVYRVRELTNRLGGKWVQSVESGATAGQFTYGAWKFIPSGDGSVNTALLADGAVTGDKVLGGSIPITKLSLPRIEVVGVNGNAQSSSFKITVTGAQYSDITGMIYIRYKNPTPIRITIGATANTISGVSIGDTSGITTSYSGRVLTLNYANQWSYFYIAFLKYDPSQSCSIVRA